jgi:hypothetical protein
MIVEGTARALALTALLLAFGSACDRADDPAPGAATAQAPTATAEADPGAGAASGQAAAVAPSPGPEAMRADPKGPEHFAGALVSLDELDRLLGDDASADHLRAHQEELFGTRDRVNLWMQDHPDDYR